MGIWTRVRGGVFSAAAGVLGVCRGGEASEREVEESEIEKRDDSGDVDVEAGLEVRVEVVVLFGNDDDGVGERRAHRCMIKEGGAWRVVNDGRKYVGVEVLGLCRAEELDLLRFEFGDGVPSLLLLLSSSAPLPLPFLTPRPAPRSQSSTRFGNSKQTRSTCVFNHSNKPSTSPSSSSSSSTFIPFNTFEPSLFEPKLVLLDLVAVVPARKFRLSNLRCLSRKGGACITTGVCKDIVWDLDLDLTVLAPPTPVLPPRNERVDTGLCNERLDEREGGSWEGVRRAGRRGQMKGIVSDVRWRMFVRALQNWDMNRESSFLSLLAFIVGEEVG